MCVQVCANVYDLILLAWEQQCCVLVHLQVLSSSFSLVHRTRAERLHTDMFHFLSDASEAYVKHFTKELQAACERGGLQVYGLCGSRVWSNEDFIFISCWDALYYSLIMWL